MCAGLGARIRTINHLTCLPRRELLRLFFPDPQAVPRGRPPDSPDWYYNANVLFRAEASIFASIFQRLRDAGFGANDSLVGAYRHYLRTCGPEPRISFDRAFDLAAHMDGIWIASAKSFDMVTCPRCGSQRLAAVGTMPVHADGCPFCKLVARYRADPRVQTSFPLVPLADPRDVPAGILPLLHACAPAGDADIALNPPD